MTLQSMIALFPLYKSITPITELLPSQSILLLFRGALNLQNLFFLNNFGKGVILNF